MTDPLNQRPLSGAELVAVYGTLKRGLCNHHWLTGARFVGTDLLTDISLYDLGDYPGARAEHSDGIEVEVFEVSSGQLLQLDELEEYNASAPEQGLYDRRLFHTRWGAAWVYLYNPPVTGLIAQRAGSWYPVQELQDKQTNI